MKVAALSNTQLAHRLRSEGILLRTGPVVTHIQTPLPEVAEAIGQSYAHHELTDPAWADFHVRVYAPFLRGHWRAQSQFSFDGYIPFKPLPRAHAFALLEWGLNWCVANHLHNHLVIHAAALERGGRAVVLAAPPGSGKSTLCAALIHRGWRLLSDELSLVRLSDGRLSALARPVNLKNTSIGIIRNFAPEAVIGRETHDTSKGTVAHLNPPPESVIRQDETAAPGWVVFPKWQAGAPAELKARSKARTLLHFADNAFNYSQLGSAGFRAAAALIDASGCYDFTYSNLDEAIAVFEQLAAT